MPRPIDADRLYNEILSMTIYVGGKQIFHPAVKQSVLDSIEMSETLDYAPVRHGEWVPLEEPQWNCFGLITIGYKCSECGREEPYNHEPYCHCGALMDGKEDSDETD